MIQTQSTVPLRPKKLGDLPDGLLMHAVMITAGPCALVQERETDGFGHAVWALRVWQYERDARRRAAPSTAAERYAINASGRWSRVRLA